MINRIFLAILVSSMVYCERFENLRKDLNFLNKQLHDPNIACDRSRRINGSELAKLMPTLIRHQHETSVSQASVSLDILRNFTDQDSDILNFLRSLLRFNRLFTEIAYVKPSVSVKNSKIMYIAQWEIDPQANKRILNNTDPVYNDLRIILGQKSDAINPADKEWMQMNKQPIFALKKHCKSDGRKAEWRLLIAWKMKSDASFYMAIPVQSIELNQCDDSPIDTLRSTHGCPNISTTCVHTGGGGLELGHYECCCQFKNSTQISSSDHEAGGGWLWKKRKQNQNLKRMFMQKYEQCMDGKLVEQARMKGKFYPGHCVEYFQSDYALRRGLLAVNILCAFATFALIFIVTSQRKVKDWGARGWALMEFFLVGAILLYCIVILEYFQASTSNCSLIPWCRELGFAFFYGAVVLKIHRNLYEHGIRKTNYVFIKEKDLLKYLLCIVAFTLMGLLAWTVTAMQTPGPYSDGLVESVISVISSGQTETGDIYMVCTFFHWNLIWHTLEFGFLTYGAYLSYKARSTGWNEKRQFAIAVALEMVVSLNMIIIKKHIWLNSNPDTLLVLSFVHAHLTVTVVVVMIMATKLYYARFAPTARDHSTASSGANRMHPSLAKLRDNLMNGTVDFADMPIGELNPEDIRAELKRVYTQLRMYKLTHLYMDNPHISKRKGGKKTSNKQANRRISIPSAPSKTSNKELTSRTNVVECDERSSLTRAGVDEENNSAGSLADFTVHTSPHNVYFSKPATSAGRLRLDSELSVCI